MFGINFNGAAREEMHGGRALVETSLQNRELIIRLSPYYGRQAGGKS
jgi:hypothetical protein